MGYETDFLAVWDALITQVQACTSFNSTNCTGAYIKDWRGITPPTCTIRPRRDRRIENYIDANLEKRETTFVLNIRYPGTGTQDNQDSIIGYVGEIIDKVNSDPTLAAAAQNCFASDSEIDYSQRREGTAVIYYAILQVRVLWMRATV